MHAHTHSIKVKNFLLLLTVAIKGAPTKCCNPFIIRLLTHSMQAALPFGSFSSFCLTAFASVRKEQNGEKSVRQNGSKRWLCVFLQRDVGTGESLAIACRVGGLMTPGHRPAPVFVYVCGQIWWPCSAVTWRSPACMRYYYLITMHACLRDVSE